jgi:gliding motility-associated lipoprotein GldH
MFFKNRFLILITFVKNNRLKQTITILILILSMFTACTIPVGIFEKNVAIPNHSWKSDFKPKIDFEVKNDTLSYYRIYIVLRHTDAYRYKNIWLNVSIQPPGDKAFINRRNLVLATDEKGWLGKGMDDIFEHRILLEPNPVKFTKRGTYTFSLEQIMREDPLMNILNAGIRLEKVVD